MQDRLLSQHSASASCGQMCRHWLTDASEPDGTKCQASQPLSGCDRELPSNHLTTIDDSYLGTSTELLAESKHVMRDSEHDKPSNTEEKGNSPFLEKTGCLGEFS